MIEKLPQTNVVDEAFFHYAMCFFKEEDWARTIAELRNLLDAYPETGRSAEALYHIGLCRMRLGHSSAALADFNETIRRFPESPWSVYAGDRIKEMRRQ